MREATHKAREARITEQSPQGSSHTTMNINTNYRDGIVTARVIAETGGFAAVRYRTAKRKQRSSALQFLFPTIPPLKTLDI